MNKKREIFFGLLLLIIAFGLGMAVKKSGDQMVQQTVQPKTQQVEQQIGEPIYQQPSATQPVVSAPIGNDGCYIGGCSNQLCSDNPNMVSTCEFAPVYSCYQSNITTCERQATGQCGWTQTEALVQCLDDHPSEIQ